MKLIKNNIQGFTFIEILITLSLAGVILALVFSFFINNLKNFNRAEHEVGLQYNGQFAVDYITNIASQSKGISFVESIDRVDKTSTSDRVNVKQITFIVENADESTSDISFSIDEISKELHSTDRVNSIAQYVEELVIQPVPSNENYSNARGIALIINLSKGDVNKRIESQIKFRNYE